MSASELSRRARERELQHRLLYDRLRRAVISRVPPLLAEFTKMVAASLIGYWVIAQVLARVGGPKPAYTFAVLGLVYSLQATYYKVKLSVDPNYRIPKCACAGRAHDDTETVLRSRHSTVLGVPNSVLGIGIYAGVLVLILFGQTNAALAVTIAAVLGSVYLGYVMVVRIRSLCATCVNIAALNVLLLLQLLI